MDGYRARNHKRTTYGSTGRSPLTARSILARTALFCARVLSADKAVRAFRYALVAASFIFLLSVVAAMESGLVSLGAGVFICLAVGGVYLLASRNCDEAEDD